jgi:hypothetical protein
MRNLMKVKKMNNCNKWFKAKKVELYPNLVVIEWGNGKTSVIRNFSEYYVDTENGRLIVNKKFMGKSTTLCLNFEEHEWMGWK